MKALTKCLLALFFVVPYSCCLLAEATACGTYATFSPDPIYAFRDSLTVTFTAPLSDVKIHGNNDGSCDDAYSLDASNVASITISREDQLTRFSASSSFHLCQGVTHLCSISRTFFALNPRNGEYKMLTFAPASIFSHIAGAQVNHAVTISNPSGSVFSARLSGYTFDYGLSLSRTCATVPAPALDSTNSYFGPNIFVLLGTTVSGNTYSLCQRVNDASTAVVADWHPLSGVYGNWEANIQADVPASSGSWTVQEATPGDGVVQYGESIVVEIPRQWYTNGVRYFGIDTGSDVCSPYLTNTFAHTDLAVVNATHHRVTTTLSRPYGQPGGGRGVICGSTGVDTPWSLLTSEMTSGAITYCAANGGVLRDDLTTCLYCAATSSDPPCYDHGDCTLDQEDKSYLLRKAPECSCDDGFYGNFCQYARLDKPVFWPENGTYKERYSLNVIVTATHSFLQLSITINSGVPFTCNTPCAFSLPSPQTYLISAYAFHTNGSRSDIEYAEYEVILPTDTRTETRTESPVITTSAVHGASTTRDPGVSSTISPSHSLENLLCTYEQEQSNVVLSEPAWFSVVGNHTCSNPNNCTASCSAGLAMDCSTLNITLKYVAPEDDHFCTATIGLTNYTWTVLVKPSTPVRDHLSLRLAIPSSAFLRPSYSAAPVPYHQRGMTWGLHPCGLDDSLVPQKVPVRSGIRVQSDCFNVSITGAGFIESSAQFTETRPRVAQKRASPAERLGESLLQGAKRPTPTETSPIVKLLGLVVLVECLFLLGLIADRRWRRG